MGSDEPDNPVEEPEETEEPEEPEEDEDEPEEDEDEPEPPKPTRKSAARAKGGGRVSTTAPDISGAIEGLRSEFQKGLSDLAETLKGKEKDDGGSGSGKDNPGEREAKPERSRYSLWR